MKRLYLDNCCYNRPYDQQSQLLVSMETQSKLLIQSMIKDRQFELATSYILWYENAKNPYEMRKEAISDFLNDYGTVYVSSAQKDFVELLAEEIKKSGIKQMDACHVACAIISKCDYFLTTDKRLLKYATDEIKIMNPIDFIREIGEENDDK